jgi:uncharacterized protein (DUF2147 family)
MTRKRKIASPKPIDSPARLSLVAPYLRTILIVAFSLSGIGTVAAHSSPIGVWRTFDDGSKTPSAEIEIYLSGDKFAGKVVWLLPSDEQSRGAVCRKCSDDRKDKPLIGLEIMRDIPKAGINFIWEGGKVLDPESGKNYKLRLELVDEGKRLRVRGYLGPFYLTETWERIQASE